jgi:hypothetical protein
LKQAHIALWLVALGLLVRTPLRAGTSEFEVKRQEVFEFAEKPKVTLDPTSQPDRFIITFASKGFCDATVAIEDPSSQVAGQTRIVRHLASGVLGPKAPEPFQKNSLTQAIIWDCKNDQGVILDDKDALVVRVSLGLAPTFEKKVFGDPKRRIGFSPPIMVAAKEGVYVFDARGTDFLRLFDHDGNYLRTLYPFDADKLDKIVGLKWQDSPLTGKKVPFKFGFTLATMLTSGTSCLFDGLGDIKHGRGQAASAMAVSGGPSTGSGQAGRIALAYNDLNRLATDGTTGGLPLKGGHTGYKVDIADGYGGGFKDEVVGPTSAALSPDGKTLYLTDYMWRTGGQRWVGGCLNGVAKLDYEAGKELEVFAGKMTRDSHGASPDQLAVPASVACDAQGRVYVADHWNDRVQVFAPDGKLLKSIATAKPSKVMIHPKNGEIWVASYLCSGVPPKVGGTGPQRHREAQADAHAVRAVRQARQARLVRSAAGCPGQLVLAEQGSAGQRGVGLLGRSANLVDRLPEDGHHSGVDRHKRDAPGRLLPVRQHQTAGAQGRQVGPETLVRR